MPHAVLDTKPVAISRLRVPAAGELPQSTQTLRAAHHDENWIAALSLNPNTAHRFASYFEQLFAASGGRLPLHDRELIAVVVSALNGCAVCEIHHTRALGDVIDDHVKAQRIALDDHLVDLTPRQRAIVDLARKVTQSPKSVSQEDFNRLREVGLSDEDILEAVETSAWFNHTNRITISIGVVPDEKYFVR